MLRAALFALLACCLAPAVADQRADTQRQLETTRQDISELQKQLGSLQQEKSGVQKQLQGTEREMGDLQKQIDALEQQLKSNEGDIRQLDGEKKKLQGQRAKQQKLIAIQIRAAYQSGGRQEYFQLLLNQQQPEQLARNLTYHGYLGRARHEQLSDFNRTLARLRDVESDLAGRHALLAGQQLELQQRREALDKARDERRATLAKLNGELGNGDQRLKERQQEQAKLASVLKNIEETLARQAREAEQRRLAGARAKAAAEAEQRRLAAARDDGRDSRRAKSALLRDGPQVSSHTPTFGGPFAAARGRLPWPVDGRLLARFGSPRDDGRLKWDGVLIGASAGSQVHAIHGGRVVFADWLRGAGLLLIVDHGDGFLSLYGHNQTLLKEAGDVIKAGEAIATVGNTGGQDTPALYFAIRQQGQPSDPLNWCRAQG